MSEWNPTGAEPVPQSAFMFNNVNDSLSFVPGKTYRLRLINMSGFSMFYFSIDGHQLEVIEIDGIATQRAPVQSVYLTPAQRVSVLVTTKNATDTNYYIHADLNTDMYDILPDDLIVNITTPVWYNNQTNNFAPSEDVGMASTFDDMVLAPIVVEHAAPYDKQVNLTFNFEVTTDGINRGMFNDIPYLSPKVPSLHTMLSEGNHSFSEEVYGPQSMAFVLNHLDMVELVVNNLDAGHHPFHLHGHVFQMVGRGNGVYDGNASNVEWFLDNPSRRDTLLIPSETFALIRFRADNPGAWFFHCHIEWHLETGLAAVMIEAPEVAQQRLTLPQAFKDICTAGGNPHIGNAAAKSGLDLSGAPSGITLIPDGFTAKGKGAMAGCIIAALIGIAAIITYSRMDPFKEARAIAAAKSQKM